jgi:hypothetical protein
MHVRHGSLVQCEDSSLSHTESLSLAGDLSSAGMQSTLPHRGALFLGLGRAGLLR